MRILDLFCKAGGATRGFQMAGFEVVGLDIEPQKRYIGDDFIQGDALCALRDLLSGKGIRGRNQTYYLSDFVAIAASPPCQHYSEGTRNDNRHKHPNLIPSIRELLIECGLPYVIENVSGAAAYMNNPVTLCGVMFPELRVYRHRLFECSFPVVAPAHTDHQDNCHGNNMISRKGYVNVFGGGGLVEYKREAMGIDWMTRDELSQAIPPAYTQFVGECLVDHLRGAV